MENKKIVVCLKSSLFDMKYKELNFDCKFCKEMNMLSINQLEHHYLVLNNILQRIDYIDQH